MDFIQMAVKVDLSFPVDRCGSGACGFDYYTITEN